MTKAEMELKARTTLAALSTTAMLGWRVFWPVIRLGVAIAAGLALVLAGALAGSAWQKQQAPGWQKALRRMQRRLDKAAPRRTRAGRF